jgi:hypothetical protein
MHNCPQFRGFHGLSNELATAYQKHGNSSGAQASSFICLEQFSLFGLPHDVIPPFVSVPISNFIFVKIKKFIGQSIRSLQASNAPKSTPVHLY